MKRYSKEEAVSIVAGCAWKYKNNLAGKSIMFVFADSDCISYMETAFNSFNYLHLTGLKVNNITAKDFFRRCINRKLSTKDFEFAADGTTHLKLGVLPSVVNSDLSARMLGSYNGSNPVLYTEKLVGGVKACVGFVRTAKSYVPNTILNLDIRDYVDAPARIIATYRKPQQDRRYTECVYKAKNIDWDTVNYPDEIAYLKNLV